MHSIKGSFLSDLRARWKVNEMKRNKKLLTFSTTFSKSFLLSIFLPLLKPFLFWIQPPKSQATKVKILNQSMFSKSLLFSVSLSFPICFSSFPWAIFCQRLDPAPPKSRYSIKIRFLFIWSTLKGYWNEVKKNLFLRFSNLSVSLFSTCFSYIPRASSVELPKSK